MTRSDMVLTPTALRFAGRRFPCVIGRGGLAADKREGDGATPRGVHRIVGMLYRPDRMARPADWAVPIRPGDLWSDDPAHEDYNLMVRAPYPHSHEALRRADPLYDLVIVTDWNWPRAVRGRGILHLPASVAATRLSDGGLRRAPPRSPAPDRGPYPVRHAADRALSGQVTRSRAPRRRPSPPAHGWRPARWRARNHRSSPSTAPRARCARRAWPAGRNAGSAPPRPAGCT